VLLHVQVRLLGRLLAAPGEQVAQVSLLFCPRLLLLGCAKLLKP
jgi:hypothetical protein